MFQVETGFSKYLVIYLAKKYSQWELPICYLLISITICIGEHLNYFFFLLNLKILNAKIMNFRRNIHASHTCKTFYGTEFAKEKWKLFVLPLLVFILSRYRAEDNSSQIEVCLKIFWNYWSLQCDVLKCRIKVIPWYNLHCILTAHIILWIISMHIIAFSLWQSLSEL